MADQELIYLIQKYLDGTCSAEEQLRVEQWYEKQSAGELHFYNDDDVRMKLAEERSLAIVRQKTQRRKLKMLFINRFAAAAAVLIVVSVAAFFYFNAPVHEEAGHTAGRQLPDTDIQPGGNRAVLTLANGKSIELSNSKTGIVINASTLTYADGTEIKTHTKGPNTASGSSALHTISTPSGGTYQVILPDGTKVWLNAASKISFPPVFSEKERRVQLTGEAYFEVAQNKVKPFNVQLPMGAEVRVTGTHFNVMAYEDEKHLSAVLTEGSIHMVSGKNAVSLKPGQEALLNKQTGTLLKKPADMEEAMAWKNGYFMFNEENIHSIMRKISRWYSVEVEYRGDMRLKDFSGTVSRYKNVSQVLQMLELTGIIHFNVEGRRIIVMP